jgi:hypothetical protein
MSDRRKAKVTVRIHYVFPPKGFETSPNQVTLDLDDVKKCLSGKPLRLGPNRWAGDESRKESEKSDPRAYGDAPTDAGSA